MNHDHGSIREQSYISAQARLDARTDYRTGGRLMYGIYENLRDLQALNAGDWRQYQRAYDAERQRLTDQDQQRGARR